MNDLDIQFKKDDLGVIMIASEHKLKNELNNYIDFLKDQKDGIHYDDEIFGGLNLITDLMDVLYKIYFLNNDKYMLSKYRLLKDAINNKNIDNIKF
tara:strand:- start:255 stop:542 length:288 start_codon:yes stop_codon:yes gene_type:complete